MIPNVSPAAERNKLPIYEQLKKLLPDSCRVLEIASGSGQHADFFTAKESHWIWQPTDVGPESLSSINAYVHAGARTNFLPPLQLDVVGGGWPHATYDAVYCANMIHIAPWTACKGLFAGANRVLWEHGMLILYGPFFQYGVEPVASNVEFDRGLRSRDPSWGVRDLAEVIAVGEENGLLISENYDMPANNSLIIFKRHANSSGSSEE